jgi:hypothetical protein
MTLDSKADRRERAGEGDSIDAMMMLESSDDIRSVAVANTLLAHHREEKHRCIKRLWTAAPMVQSRIDNLSGERSKIFDQPSSLPALDGFRGVSPRSDTGITSSEVPFSSSQIDECTVFVDNLPPWADREDLLAVFCNPDLGHRGFTFHKPIEPFRNLKGVEVAIDPVTGVSNGFGFVR